MNRLFVRICLRAVYCVVLTFALVSCSSGGGSSSEEDQLDEQSTENDQSAPDPDEVSFSSLCGVVRVERLVNPITEGELVQVEVIDSDTVAVSNLDGSEDPGPRLVKLHAITSNGINQFRRLNGIAEMQERVAGGAIFVPAGEECDVLVDGSGAGRLGQIFSLDGQNISELMLQLGAAAPEADICEGDTLAACYATIGVLPRPPSDIELDLVPVSLASQCGAVKNQSLLNPVPAAEQVNVDVASVNEVVITRLRGVEVGNQQAVKLHGLSTEGVPAFRLALGLNLLASETAGGAYFVAASQTCEAVFSGGGRGVFGQLYSLSGLSLNEELIRMGAAVPISDPCGGEQLLGCYSAIEVEAPDPGSEQPSDQIINDFLWKPVSESNGLLVVLVNPENVRVVVSGAITETLTDFGPSNGRGTTARGSRSGCAYGNNIRLDFFDAAGNRIFIADGRGSVTVPSGCQRLEFRL